MTATIRNGITYDIAALNASHSLFVLGFPTIITKNVAKISPGRHFIFQKVLKLFFV